MPVILVDTLSVFTYLHIVWFFQVVLLIAESIVYDCNHLSWIG